MWVCSTTFPAISIVSVVARAVGAPINGIIHRPVLVHLFPHTIVRPCFEMVHPILVKRTSHPASVSFVTDTREWLAKPGMTWARRAASGSSGIIKSHSLVDDIVSPLGSFALKGICVGLMLSAGAVLSKK